VVELPDAARLLLALEPPETVFEVWHAAHRLGGRLVHKEVDGYLVLTDRRVAFVQVVGSGSRRTYHTVPGAVIPLEAITELREDPPGILRISGAEYRVKGPGGSTAGERVERARVGRIRELAERPPTSVPAGPPVLVRERVILREIVRVPCRYCGALNEQRALRCLACGAPATR
jgi:hypothetical protein